MDDRDDWDAMVLVGFVARTHGNRGEVILKSETDFPEQRFRVGGILHARRSDGPIERLEVTTVRFQQGRPIVGICGHWRRSARRNGWRATSCACQRPSRRRLPDGTYYHHQLIGCEVETRHRRTHRSCDRGAGRG